MPSLNPSLPLRPWLVALLLCTSATATHAGELYGAAGFPGLMAGYAHPFSDHFGLRGDYATLGTRTKTMTEEGITYNGRLTTNRMGLYGDWFPFGGSFRLIGGLTFNRYELTLDATGAAGSINIGGREYATSNEDGLLVKVTYPKTTPYLGLGWGHHAAGPGLRFAFDLGASIGKAKVTATPRGILANSTVNPYIQDDIDKEMAEVESGVGKIKAIPQLTLSVGYSF